ncbi:hypothetical protein MASR1M59_15540 [Melaminivora sp.]
MAQAQTSAKAPTSYTQEQQLLKTGQAAQALEQLDKRLHSQGRDPQLRFLRTVALTELGRQDEALSALVDLTETYPELPEPYNNLAVLYAARGELGKARDALESAVRAQPDYPVAQENLGDIYLRLAAQAYTRASQPDPVVAKSVQPKLTLLRQLLAPPQSASR